MRTAEIRDISFVLKSSVSQTEADLATAVLSMDLRRDREGWYARSGFAIAIRQTRADGVPLEVVDPEVSIYKYATDYTPSDGERLIIERIRPESQAVIIPNNRFLVADMLSMRTRMDGLEVELLGSQEVQEFYDEETRRDHHITESATAKISHANLPVRIGLIAQDKLVNIEPVVFRPVGES